MLIGPHRQAGNTTIEFTLVGLPLIFVLISIFEMARGMWVYVTMAHAIREGARFATVHGFNNPVTIGTIAQQIQYAGVGLDPNQLTISFKSQINNPVTPLTCGSPSYLINCLSSSVTWPSAPDNATGFWVEIDGTIPFRSALAMFWPGAGKGVTFGAFYFPAVSQQIVQF